MTLSLDTGRWEPEPCGDGTTMWHLAPANDAHLCRTPDGGWALAIEDPDIISTQITAEDLEAAARIVRGNKETPA